MRTCHVVDFTMAKRTKRKSIGGADPRKVPFYTIAEAAFCVGVAPMSLHQWIYGRDYKAKGEIRHSPGLIDAADARRGLLSFANLTEAHVLGEIRRRGFRMPVIREALNAIREAYPADRAHPLNSGEFLRHGKVLFLKKLEETVNLSRPRQGQLVLGGDLLDPVLERIVRDDDGPFRLFPMK